MSKLSVYDQVVDVTYDYLGPASQRFIAREIEAHLGKKPEKLKREDIEQLHDWCKVAIALLTDDTKMVDEYSRKFLALSKQHI